MSLTDRIRDESREARRAARVLDALASISDNLRASSDYRKGVYIHRVKLVRKVGYILAIAEFYVEGSRRVHFADMRDVSELAAVLKDILAGKITGKPDRTPPGMAGGAPEGTSTGG